MNKLLFFLSIKYWSNHKKRLVVFILALTIGTASLTCSGLLIRSSKLALIEEGLCMTGDYDAILYNTTSQVRKAAESFSYVEAAGSYLELGYAKAQDGENLLRIGAFHDEISEKIYHLTCLRGEYPENEHEIAIDLSTAKSLGVAPYPGEKVKFSLHDNNRQFILEKEYAISGIFEMKSDELYAGYLRYPYAMEENEYEMPIIFLNQAEKVHFKENHETIFVQLNNLNTSTFFDDIKGLNIEDAKNIEDKQLDENGRHLVYNEVLGNPDEIWTDYDDGATIKNLEALISEGKVEKDFYSGILIPIFAVLVAFISFLSVYEILQNVLKDRMEQIGLFRSIGMSSRKSSLLICSEIGLMALILIPAGILFGMLMYKGILYIQGDLLEIQTFPAFTVDRFTEAATMNPYSYPALVMALCILPAVLIPLYRLRKSSPMECLYRMDLKIRKQKRRTLKQTNHTIKRGWLKVINEHIKINDVSIMMMLIVAMSAALFGYLYFQEQVKSDNRELQSKIEESQLYHYDYAAYKRSDIGMYNFQVENRHDYGIPKQAFDDFIHTGEIEDFSALIKNLSAKLSYPSGTKESAEKKQLLESYILQPNPPNPGSEWEQALFERDAAVLSAMGYSHKEDVYEIPMCGTGTDELKKLEKYIVAGRLNEDKLKKGEEVILAVQEGMEYDIASYFAVGESLPLSDIVLNEEEEGLDFNMMSPEEIKEPVYRKKLIEPELNEEREIRGYAFGKRKNIGTQVGAILVISEEDTADFYLTKSYEGETCINVLVHEDALPAWGLPDKNYTNVGVSAKNGADEKKLDMLWYDCIGESKGISANSTAEIEAAMQVTKQRTMSIFYALILLLILVDTMAVGNALYTKIHLQTQRIAILRGIGMDNKQLRKMILSQNAVYPIIGSVCSLVPLFAFHTFMQYIYNKVETGQWQGMFSREVGESLPWWMNLPFHYNLLSQNWILAAIIIFTLYIILIVFVTMPQLRFMEKRDIISDMGFNRF